MASASGATTLQQSVARSVTGWVEFGGGSARLGSTPSSVGTPHSGWFVPLAGTITTQPLVARDLPRAGDVTVVVGTAEGFVYALAANGYVRWRVDLGRLAHVCTQVPDGWGVTGTPVVDAATATVYVADAFGRLHALDLATGVERAGWPIVLYRDYRRELVWAALLLVDGSVYVPTGSYCDQPMEGKLIRVRLATREVSSWTVVPASLGGGGGIWGWGGAAYSAVRDSIFVVTGNAFEGGSNRGAAFSEAAGYGEHLVELSRALEVRSASAPKLEGFADLDFVGSPVVAGTARCGEIVAAQAKNGALFGWRSDAVAAGPAWQVKLQKADPAAPLLTQPAYSPPFDSFFAVTASQLVRVSLDDACRPRIAWATTLGEPTLYGSPTVAGEVVWVALPAPEFSDKPAALLGVDGATGRMEVRHLLGSVSFAPPAIVHGMLFVGAMHGLTGGRFPVGRGRPASDLPGYTSGLDGRHLWQSREDGVYSTDDGGRTWKRISSRSAVRVVRTALRTGVISLGLPPASCDCTTRRLWTSDGGRSWRPLGAVGADFQGQGSSLYWWKKGSLFRVDTWPPRAGSTGSRRVARVDDGTIVSVANVPGGVAALVDRRTRPPQVILARGAEADVVTLPDAGDAALARSISARGSALVVRGKDFSSPSAAPDETVEWRSGDGGRTWVVTH